MVAFYWRWGFEPGPEVGKILDYLLEVVLDEPELNSAEKLIKLVKSYKPK